MRYNRTYSERAVATMGPRWDLLHCSLCITMLCFTTIAFGAPLDDKECNVPLDVDVTECCSSKISSTDLKEPLLPPKCSSILLISDTSSQEELENMMECFFECLFATAELLNENNKIDTDNLLVNLTEELQPSSRMLSISKIKDCIEKDYETKETAECKSGSLQFFLCIQRENTLHCPSENWKNTDECNKYRLLLEKCPKRTPIFGFFNLKSQDQK